MPVELIIRSIEFILYDSIDRTFMIRQSIYRESEGHHELDLTFVGLF